MTVPKRPLGLLAIAGIAASLVIPAASASATPRTFQQIYPLATRVCANVAAGKASKRVQANATAVLADCKALEEGFTKAQTTMTTARATIAAGVAADHALVTASCPAPATPQTQRVCAKTTNTEKTAIKALHSELMVVMHTYFTTINANRHTFWTAIKALPGEAHVKTDTPLPVPPA